MIEAIIIPLVGALLTPLLSKTHHHFRYVAASTSLLSFLAIVLNIPAVRTGTVLTQRIWEAPPYSILLSADAFSIFVALLVSGVFFLISVHSIEFMYGHHHEPYFYTLLQLMLSGLMGITLTGDLFNMYVFLEVACVASYGLVAYYRNRHAIAAAARYITISAFGTSMILLGLALLYSLFGTLNIAHLMLMIDSTNILTPLSFIFFFTGFAIKIALVPFHLWKPAAISASPSPVSAILASVAVAAGIHMLARVAFFAFHPYFYAFPKLLAFFGGLTMVVGALMAFVQTDMKRLLAFAGISQTGYIIAIFSVLSYSAFFAGIFQLFNFVIAEALLFICAGAVVFRTRTTKLSELGGLADKMPLTASAFLVGALSITGAPPFSGFASKWLIYAEMLNRAPILLIIALLTSALTAAYMLKAFSTIFLGPSFHKVTEVGFSRIPIIILSAACILFGIYPELLFRILHPATASMLSLSRYVAVIL